MQAFSLRPLVANWFIALVLPGEAGWNRSVPSLPEGVLILSVQDLHVTVAFLGSCGEAAALRAWRGGASMLSSTR